MKNILYIAAILSVVTYGFWQYFPKGSFYIGNSLCIVLLCAFIFFKERKSFIGFVLFSYSVNNLFDELFFNPGVIGINEFVFSVIIPLLWYIKTKYYARQNNLQ